MAHIQYVDELIKQYLAFRGFTSTLRALDNDLKSDKDKGFRVDKITDQILNHILTYDLVGLRELWSHLDRRIFARLSQTLQPCVRKLETSILKYYVINTVQTSKLDKLCEFFEKMAAELQHQSDWKEWFILPYLKSTEDNPAFAMYFTKQWQDTLMVSLQNFLSVIFQNMALPTLAAYHEEAAKITKLQEENELLHARLAALTVSEAVYMDQVTITEPPPPPNVMDDVFDIAPEQPVMDNQLKSLKNILFGRGAGGGSTTPVSPTARSSKEAPLAQSSRRSTQHSDDRRRQRSSSLAPSGSHSSDHAPAKRLVQASSVSSRMSRSPTKPSQEDLLATESFNAPFLLLGQEEYSEHRSVVTHTVFSPSGSLVASADVDGVVKLWNPSPSPKTEFGMVMKSSLNSVGFLPRTEKMLLLASKSSFLRLFDCQEKKTVWEVNSEIIPAFKDSRIMVVKVMPNEASAFVSLSSRGRTLSGSCGTSLPCILVFDLRTQKLEYTVKVDSAAVNNCALNHNGGLLICGCNDGYIRVLDTRMHEVVASWLAHQGEVFTVKLSPQEDKIYTIGSDNRFACWSFAQTGSKLLDHSLHDRAAGPFLVGVSAGGEAGGFGNGRAVLLRPYGHLFAVHNDGKYLFTCSPSGPIIYKICDNKLQQVMALKGHKSPVVTIDWCTVDQCGSCVSASLDGQVILSTLLPQ